ncbi:MAG: AAA family ATPase, partial [Nitrospiraceae bacterium]|nr:AAA family ATPase [Nitrospiraceae bacterium]
MYEEFYGLTERPFNLTPDPRFLYLSEKHKEAFAHLLFGIKNRSGFIMVSGEIGTGKTTICRSLLNQLDADTEVAFIFNPCLSPEELLRHINQDFGIETRGQTVKELVDELNEFLLARNARGKNCVLVIDEAQNLAPGVLEQIRLLSNLETETQKLLQIVLIGQPELAEHLQLPELRQLNQRITARYHLKALNREETLQYIAYRLRTAGGKGKVGFTRAAVRAVYRISGGTPRVINSVCDRALLIGYTREMRDIGKAIVKRAAREIRGERVKRKKRTAAQVAKSFLPNPALVGMAAVAMGFLFMVKYLDLSPVRYPDVPPPAYPTGAAAPPPVFTPRSQNTIAEATVAEPREPIDEAATRKAIEYLIEALKPTPPPPPLSERLSTIDPAAARHTALTAVLRAWDMALVGARPEGDSAEELITFAKSNGLTVETPEPTIDALGAIRLPVLALMQAGGRTFWTAWLGVENGKFRITTETAEGLLVSREELQSCFAGKALVLWRDSRPDAPKLRENMRGPEVLELQRNLIALGRFWSEPTGVFDEKTRRAIARIQVETGIDIDGVVGKQVRMVLASWLRDAQTPRWERESTPADPPPVQAETVTADAAPVVTEKAEEEPPETGAVAPEAETPEQQEPPPS